MLKTGVMTENSNYIEIENSYFKLYLKINYCILDQIIEIE